MPSSMTSFARAELDGGWGRAAWELRSVNHRYYEVFIRLPEDFRGMEATVRERVGSRIKRGKVDCTLRFHAAPAELRDLNINNRLAADLIQAADNIGSMIGPTTPISSFDVLRWPGVIEADEIELDTVSQELLRILDQALDELLQTRRREGNKLKTMIVQRCAGIREQLQVLCSRVPEIIESLRGRYEQRVHQVAEGLDAARVEQECALLVQRLDVAEELDRIGAHVDEVLRVLESEGADRAPPRFSNAGAEPRGQHFGFEIGTHRHSQCFSRAQGVDRADAGTGSEY